MNHNHHIQEIPTVNNHQEKLRVHVGEMLAVTQHVHEALERQAKDETVHRYPAAHQAITEAQTSFALQTRELESLIDGFDERFVDKVKKGVTDLLGNVAGLYDKLRGDEVSRMLRDDYTALSLTSASYTMLHAAALAYGQPPTAELALRHLKKIAGMVMRFAEVLPEVVVSELAAQHEGVDGSVGSLSRDKTQEAWNRAAAKSAVTA